MGACLVQCQQKRAACAGLLHTDFMHLAGSLLPWAVLACILELNYGSVRVVILWLVSLLGAAFTSAVLDPPCQVVRISSLDICPRQLDGAHRSVEDARQGWLRR